MSGHDAQRTAQSPGPGPTDAHLVRMLAGFHARLIAPDGSIIGYLRPGQDRETLATLGPSGKVRRLATLREFPVAVDTRGEIITMGFEDRQAQAFSMEGKLVWRNRKLGFDKGAEPLVTRVGEILAPALGHPDDGTAGLYILSSRGKLVKQIARGTITSAVASAPGGRIYSLSYSNQRSAVTAYSPAYKKLWQQPLSFSILARGACDCPVVGKRGMIVVGDGDSLVAFAPSGRVLWRVQKADGALSVAARADGSIVVAGGQSLTVVSPQGETLFETDMQLQHSLGASDNPSNPSLAVDVAGTIYVGTTDGDVLIVAANGQIVTRLSAGGYYFGQTPGVLLGPMHMLVVNGTDGNLRIYT